MNAVVPKRSPVRPFRGAAHHTLNRRLVGGVADERPRPVHGLDAIVVPSGRDPRHLLDSLSEQRHFSFAGALRNVPIVLLRTATGADAVTERKLGDIVRESYTHLRVMLVEVPLNYSAPGPSLATEEIAAAESGVFADTALKRNIGLLLAIQMHWRSVLFLDDDVIGLTDDVLTRTRALLSHYDAVGWAFAGDEAGLTTPDNSMVCHVHRMCGGLQDTFIGAGALAVRCHRNLPFFPAVYNEDWLFLAPLIAQKRVALAGELKQTFFQPLKDPRRARDQEFGEVLAVGLFGLLHRGLALRAGGSSAHWKEVLRRRRRLLAGLQRSLFGTPGTDAAQALRTIENARSAHERHWPDTLAEYCRAWESDRLAWSGLLGEVENSGTSGFSAALRQLGLATGCPPGPSPTLADISSTS